MDVIIHFLLIVLILGFVFVVLGKKTLKNIFLYLASALIVNILFVLYILSQR